MTLQTSINEHFKSFGFEWRQEIEREIARRARQLPWFTMLSVRFHYRCIRAQGPLLCSSSTKVDEIFTKIQRERFWGLKMNRIKCLSMTSKWVLLTKNVNYTKFWSRSRLDPQTTQDLLSPGIVNYLRYRFGFELLAKGTVARTIQNWGSSPRISSLAAHHSTRFHLKQFPATFYCPCPCQSLSCKCNKIICTVEKWIGLVATTLMQQRSQVNWCKAEKLHWLLSIVHQFNWFAHTIYFRK